MRRAWKNTNVSQFAVSPRECKFDPLRAAEVHSCGVDVAERELGPSQVLTSLVHYFTLGVLGIGL
jgi:hypothetical protein